MADSLKRRRIGGCGSRSRGFVRLLGCRNRCRVNAGIAPWILYFFGISASDQHGGKGIKACADGLNGSKECGGG
jgi:hypothetical protein